MTDPNKVSGSSLTRKTVPPSADFIAENHFTLFLLYACSQAAKSWIEEHLPPDRLTFGQAVVIEARCFWPIVEVLQAEGYVVVSR